MTPAVAILPGVKNHGFQVKIEQVIYFKYKNMLHNISELSSGAVRSKFNILYDFHELEGLLPCGSASIHTIY